MQLNPLVSIIMPTYNSEKFIFEAINSILNQTYTNFELLIINDGSNDHTMEIIHEVPDDKIQYFEQDNKGVSKARNLGLSNMRGEFFCFMDADDVMPSNSIMSRLQIFQKQPNISFVDGKVVYMNEEMLPIGKSYIPSFKGYPYNELLQVSNSCCFGNTWMIKREMNIEYKFNEELTHCEDLCFYLSISEGRKYDFTINEVLHYRIIKNSAMSDFSGLENGYKKLYHLVDTEHNINWKKLLYMKYKIIRIMTLSYLFDKKSPLRSIRVFFRYLFL
ncbi:glycosyl transferase family 2 [Candidatus Woesearchaeota archaeon]|nr:glycosyl transferase family 2 [Candidatus Woesearchaeota archaeon]